MLSKVDFVLIRENNENIELTSIFKNERKIRRDKRPENKIDSTLKRKKSKVYHDRKQIQNNEVICKDVQLGADINI